VTSAPLTTPDTTSQPDEHVVGALVHDLDSGFVALFNAYRPAVFSATLRVTGRWADAEDLTAEAFLRAYRALCGYQPERIRALRPRSWLLTIALNLWRTNVQAAARRLDSEPLEAAPDPPDPRQDVQQTVDDRQFDRRLAAALAELPDDQRVAVVLRHVLDLPLAEVAEVLGRREGTVKSQVSRGLAKLRERYPPGPTTKRPRPKGTTQQRSPIHLVPSNPLEVRR
jgi:RNA polymerase sigma-70 factor (ECF subfamily)